MTEPDPEPEEETPTEVEVPVEVEGTSPAVVEDEATEPESPEVQ